MRGGSRGARALRVGPLRVELELDAALDAAAPAGWDAAAGAGGPGLRLSLRALAAAPPGGEGFGPGGTLQGGGCRLARGAAPDVVEGACVSHRVALEHAVRFATQPRLLELGWLLVHGSSVRLGDGAHVFTAPSGTGKSTLARRLAASGALLLGDEVALLSEEGLAVHPGQPSYGPPGTLHRPVTVHLLRRGEPAVRPAGRARAVAELTSAAMVYEDGRAAAERVLALAQRLAESARVVETSVPDDERATALVRAFARGGP